MSNPYRYRMAIALLALVAALVALYLHLWKAGYTGTLSCTSGRGCGCYNLERVFAFTPGGQVTLVQPISDARHRRR